MQTKTELKNALAISSLTVEMVRRGLSENDLAMLCGVEKATLLSEFGRGFTSDVLRHRIERVLGFPLTLWSTAQEIELRERCIREFGEDPRALFLDDLKAFCRRRGTDSPSVRTRENWYEMLVRWCAKNPERRRAA